VTSQILPRLVCAGSVVVDVVMHVQQLPDPGGDVVARGSMLAVGGAFNVMSAARAQGLAVTYAGGRGTGPFGDMVRSMLAQAGIDVITPAAPNLDTGFTVTFVAMDGERTFITAPGAEARLTVESLNTSAISEDDFVYVSGYGLAYPGSGPALAAWVSRLPAGTTVVADPGPLVGEIPKAVLQEVAGRSTWWTCNEREAHLMTGAANRDESIRAVARIAGRKGVLVRVGRDGCLLLMRDGEVQHVTGQSVEAVNTTGAGDIHTGTFIAALAHGLEPAEAVRRANVAASIVVSTQGPPRAPTSSELNRAMVTQHTRSRTSP
jgi:sugar/nucleoside kinase (ribokinase family)